MKFNEIKAQIMTEWNHPNSKLLPGDLAQVCKLVKPTSTPSCCDYKNSYYSKNLLKRSEARGIVVAVTTTNGSAIRGIAPNGWAPRAYTKYYLKFGDGDIHGFLAGHLTKIDNEITEPIT